MISKLLYYTSTFLLFNSSFLPLSEKQSLNATSMGYTTNQYWRRGKRLWYGKNIYIYTKKIASGIPLCFFFVNSSTAARDFSSAIFDCMQALWSHAHWFGTAQRFASRSPRQKQKWNLLGHGVVAVIPAAVSRNRLIKHLDPWKSQRFKMPIKNNYAVFPHIQNRQLGTVSPMRIVDAARGKMGSHLISE